MSNNTYEMRLNLRVLRPLGINLYSNLPPVLSEVVANSWDADATEVDIQIERGKIVITDDGDGMDQLDINNKYLRVGYDRRSIEPGLTGKYKRKVMGRKGIGKLSLFSIAGTIEIHTIKGKEKNGFVMSMEDIESRMSEDEQSYFPKSIDKQDVQLDKNGTRIILTDLRKRADKTPVYLRKRLARRFSIMGADHKFTIKVNDKPVDITDRGYFDKLQYLWHYGEEGKKCLNLCPPKKLEHEKERPGIISVEDQEDGKPIDYPVTGWIGTVKKSGDLTDKEGDDNLNKIVIMVRGKLAQEDILEDFREGGLYTKYLIGEIHADFLDQDDKIDTATSNRQEIIKDDPRYEALRKWVSDELKYIATQWQDLRGTKGVQEATEIQAINEWISNLNSRKRKQAESLFRKIGRLTLSPEDKTELYKHSILAFECLRYKGALDELDKVAPENLQVFTRLFSEVSDIEESWYYQITQGRLKIVEKLHKHARRNEKEKIIQKHLYNHLWLLDPSWDRATETPLMEQSVEKEFEKLDAKLTKTQKQKAGRFDIKYRKTAGKHVIIELKRAGRTLSEHDLHTQVTKYRDALQKQLQAIDRSDEPVEVVCLVGKRLKEWDTPENEEESKRTLAVRNIRVVLYDQLIEDAYRNYQAYLEKHREAGYLHQLIQSIEISM